MTELVSKLMALAFETAEASLANSAIEAVRERRSFDGGSATSYEVALPGVDVDGFLTSKTLPKLVYFLDCRGQRPPTTPRTFVSLFTPQGLYFIDAGAMVMALGAALGVVTPAELVRRYGENGTGDPKRLGP
jgi:hypothetical protein